MRAVGVKNEVSSIVGAVVRMEVGDRHNDDFRNMDIALPRAVGHSNMGVDDGILGRHGNECGTNSLFGMLRSNGQHLHRYTF